MINTSAALAASSTDIANTIKSRHAVQEQTLTQFFYSSVSNAANYLRRGNVLQLAQFF